MNWRTVLAVVAVSLGVSGCARTVPLTVDRTAGASINSADKNVVLVNHTQWDVDVRKALAKAGFNVKRFASTTETQITNGAVAKTFNEAEARYGITQYPGGEVDHCIGAKSIRYDEYTLELADLRTNEVVMTVQKGGWTGDCGSFSRGQLFDELSGALLANWR